MTTPGRGCKNSWLVIVEYLSFAPLRSSTRVDKSIPLSQKPRIINIMLSLLFQRSWNSCRTASASRMQSQIPAVPGDNYFGILTNCVIKDGALDNRFENHFLDSNAFREMLFIRAQKTRKWKGLRHCERIRNKERAIDGFEKRKKRANLFHMARKVSWEVYREDINYTWEALGFLLESSQLRWNCPSGNGIEAIVVSWWRRIFRPRRRKRSSGRHGILQGDTNI